MNLVRTDSTATSLRILMDSTRLSLMVMVAQLALITSETTYTTLSYKTNNSLRIQSKLSIKVLESASVISSALLSKHKLGLKR